MHSAQVQTTSFDFDVSTRMEQREGREQKVTKKPGKQDFLGQFRILRTGIL